MIFHTPGSNSWTFLICSTLDVLVWSRSCGPGLFVLKLPSSCATKLEMVTCFAATIFLPRWPRSANVDDLCVLLPLPGLSRTTKPQREDASVQSYFNNKCCSVGLDCCPMPLYSRGLPSWIPARLLTSKLISMKNTHVITRVCICICIYIYMYYVYIYIYTCTYT